MLPLRSKIVHLAWLIPTAAFSLAAASCSGTFQDARLVPPGGVRITASAGTVGASFQDEEFQFFANTYAAQAQVGISQLVDLGLGYAGHALDDEDSLLHTFAFGPRMSVVRDRVAVALPVSFAWGGQISVADSWMVHPAALFTIPVHRQIDLNPSVRLLMPTCEGCETFVAFGFGLGLRLNPRLRFRPEVTAFRNPGQRGTIWSVGVGTSIDAR
jgi:hypothetical protein